MTNRLINETSPYLLQHAQNPVDWYPWGEEAFSKAKTENKPVLLSIGYSACHWCHVMEHESFENEAIARLMNDNFINIKVDREERPDLDQIYMNAVQMMTHHGGWPMTVFLTPDGVPFYGGTYFPPEDRYNVPGFPRVLIALAEAYRERHEEITQHSTALLAELQKLSGATESAESIDTSLLDSTYQGVIKNYDYVNGGFGEAPKFPPAMTLEFLLRTYHRTGSPEALEIVSQTCKKMALGGIYDQIGGGFHRYSTDAKWLVPHFEKMLYDNALLSRLYLHFYQLTGDDLARSTVEGILDYVVREMTAPEGGFYSTQDADSEGHEGKFFVWTTDEICEIVGVEDARLFSALYNITSAGNFEGKNIPNITRSVEEVARAENASVEQLRAVVARSRERLFAEREDRVKPARDEKILTSWNGLMLGSFAEAGAALGRDDYAQVAQKSAEFVLGNLRRNGLLLRSFKDGQAKLNAYLEDYAFLTSGLLTLFETTGEIIWFQEAVVLAETMIKEFWDEDEGGFYFTGKSHEQLIVRSKDYFDNATPSGNSVAAEVVLRLALLTNEQHYRDLAVRIFRLISQPVRRYPSGFGYALSAIDLHLSSPKEIVILSESGSEPPHSLLREVWQRYLPNKIVVQAAFGSETGLNRIPLLTNRTLIGNLPTAYVCENYTCKQPVTDPKELAAQLTSHT